MKRERFWEGAPPCRFWEDTCPMFSIKKNISATQSGSFFSIPVTLTVDWTPEQQERPVRRAPEYNIASSFFSSFCSDFPPLLMFYSDLGCFSETSLQPSVSWRIYAWFSFEMQRWSSAASWCEPWEIHWNPLKVISTTLLIICANSPWCCYKQMKHYRVNSVCADGSPGKIYLNSNSPLRKWLTAQTSDCKCCLFSA